MLKLFTPFGRVSSGVIVEVDPEYALVFCIVKSSISIVACTDGRVSRACFAVVVDFDVRLKIDVKQESKLSYFQVGGGWLDLSKLLALSKVARPADPLGANRRPEITEQSTSIRVCRAKRVEG